MTVKVFSLKLDLLHWLIADTWDAPSLKKNSSSSGPFENTDKKRENLGISMLTFLLVSHKAMLSFRGFYLMTCDSFLAMQKS